MRNIYLQLQYFIVLLSFFIFVPNFVQGQENPPSAGVSNASIEKSMDEELVIYPAVFFQRYTPNTAFDMIQQVPGFQLNDGDNSRGLGAAAGNILINDRRPSAKQDLPSLILSRIPASLVERIELIRGQVRDIDLQGESVIANIILRDDSPVAIRWTSSWRYHLDLKSTFEGGTSISGKWKDIDYNAGFDYRYYTRGDFTLQERFDGDEELYEKRNDNYFLDGVRGSANLNTATFLGENYVKFNTTFGWDNRDGLRQVQRIPQPQGSGFRREFLAEDFQLRKVEVGGDVERNLTRNLQSTAIALFINSKEDKFLGTRRSLHTLERTLLRAEDTDRVSTEAIARLEFDWTAIPNHTVQFNLEGAFNSRDGELFQTEDKGTGPNEVNVPGANTVVEEVRGDFFLKDTWSLGVFELDYGVGGEISKISQTGDEEQERSFFFLKPQGILTYSSGQGEQTRMRLAREISQLNFNDFISITVPEDDDITLGNPNLRPDATWIAEVIHERRFGPQSVLKLTAFHHWISHVVDLLPLTADFEATGNIGSGRRWGLELETTIPLEWAGLHGARLDINARWQDSSVVDPVTGKKRVLSDRLPPGRLMPLIFYTESDHAITIDYRQDFQAERIAWGWNIRSRGERPKFRADELDILDEGVEFNTFFETTRWFGLKTRFTVENIFDLVDRRDRVRYVGERDSSSVEFHEIRDRVRSLRIAIWLSGSF